MDGRTVKGKVKQSGGGVGRNIADALVKLQIKPCLISAVGDENFGLSLLDTIPYSSRKGIKKLKEISTGTCIIFCDHTGECLVAVGDMAIHEQITPSQVQNHVQDLMSSSLVILDGNLPQNTIEFVLRLCRENHKPVWFEPTDILKASKPFLDKSVPPPTFISPNLLEFREIYQKIYPGTTVYHSDVVEECIQKGYLLAEVIENIIITLGEKGVMVIRKGKKTDGFFVKGNKPEILQSKGQISHRMYKPDPLRKDQIVNVSGAGDCFASGFIAAMLRGETEEQCVRSGFKCSTASLKCPQTVPENFKV